MRKLTPHSDVKKLSICLALLAFFVVPMFAPPAAAQSRARTLQGKVLSSSDKPLSGAIVYLKDNRTNSIRSFISTSDGSYHFGQLARDTDYQVWARYKNDKSDTKGISSYDSRDKVVINFRIKTE
jgi:hypothetical protein